MKLSCARSTAPMGQNPWVSRWLFWAYLSPTPPAAYEARNIAWMTKLPGFSASSPVVVGDWLFATCGTSDLVCIRRSDGRVLWLTTCTPCDAATDADRAAPAYREAVEPLAAELERANAALVPALNALSPVRGPAKDAHAAADQLIKRWRPAGWRRRRTRARWRRAA